MMSLPQGSIVGLLAGLQVTHPYSRVSKNSARGMCTFSPSHVLGRSYNFRLCLRKQYQALCTHRAISTPRSPSSLMASPRHTHFLVRLYPWPAAATPNLAPSTPFAWRHSCLTS